MPFDPRRFSPGHPDFGKPIEEPTTADPSSARETESSDPWSGYEPAFSIDDLTEAPRRTLIAMCGAAGHLGPDGAPLPDHLLVRRARIKTHPDHRGGDRTAWDQVEEAAVLLSRLRSEDAARR